MGCFVRPGLVAVADISATLRVRFPFRVPREVGLFHARVRVRAAAALHVRRLGRHRRRRREHGRRGRRRAHRGTCSSCASTGRPSSSLSSSSPSESAVGGAAAATRAPCQSPTRRSRLPSRASARSSGAAAARARAARAAAARVGARAGRPSARRRRCPLRRFRSVFLLARFEEIWSLEMEDACRVCPRAYLLRLLRVSVRFSQSSRTQPMPTNSPQSWSIFDRRLYVSGALFFFWRCAGGAFGGNLVVGNGRCLSSVPTRLSVAAATRFCSFFAIVAHSAHAIQEVPNPGRFSIVVCVSRVLFSSSGGALVACFGKIWSLEMEDACRVCQRACLSWLLRVSAPIFRNRRAMCPCQ